KYNDTEFGGKTGTSNNHSDAWFVGVSPKLVCGAWVGGEYRSIHFRTGALGQGSRTALPICGYFYESVLGDPAFKHYHGRFPKSQDPSIRQDQYMGCAYVPSLSDSDSLAIDSLGFELEQDVELDNEGNVIVKPQEPANVESGTAPASGGEATEPKKKTQPQVEDVYL
ncbi:MAG: penicillin-binding protein, partial [Prevotella sp.]|nr:penicillin-binding protein [Prevotella sp.]